MAKKTKKNKKTFAQLRHQVMMKHFSAAIPLFFFSIFQQDSCDGTWLTQNNVNSRSRSDNSERDGGKKKKKTWSV